MWCVWCACVVTHHLTPLPTTSQSRMCLIVFTIYCLLVLACFFNRANRKCYNVCCLKCCQTVGVHSCKVHKHTAPTIVHPVTTPTTVRTTAPTIVHPVTTPTTVPTTVSSDSNTTTIRRSTRVNRGHHSERLNI